MRRHLTSLLHGIWLTSSLIACGATNKDASEVAAMFSGPAQPLEDRVESVCSALRRRKTAPTTAGLELAVLDKCKGAGQNAINAKNYDGFRLQQYTIANGTETDKQRSSFRLQLWFNSPLIGITSLASNLSDLGDAFSSQEIPIDQKDLENAAKVDVKVVDKFALNLDGEVRGGIGLKFALDGIAKLNMQIRVDFTVIKNSVAVVVKSDKAEGVIADLFMVLMVTPYANDTYLDMIGSIKIGDILNDAKVIDGLAPSLTETILKALFKLDRQQSVKSSKTKTGAVEKSSATAKKGAPK
ncbi:MAG: hypothetical protein FJ146_13525 [Deltaproteobacteria bacterium]|nr:hypothetical protein [Deltaproteobacteria bacterium]